MHSFAYVFINATLSVLCAIGSLSCNILSYMQASTQAAVSNTDGSYSYVKSRTAYRVEVAALRKEFIVEVARRKEKLARDAEYVVAFQLHFRP